jgi:hypothetical protein
MSGNEKKVGKETNDCCVPRKSEPIEGEILLPGKITSRASLLEKFVKWADTAYHLADYVENVKNNEQRIRNCELDGVITQTRLNSAEGNISTLTTEVADLRKMMFTTLIAGMVAGTVFMCTTMTLLVVYLRH